MLLYHNKYEFSRVVEVLAVTEEGTFVSGDTPGDYAGSVLTLEVVHRITLVDATGRLEVMHFDNPAPLRGEDRKTHTGAILLDGKEIRTGSGEPRKWTTRAAPNLSPARKQLGTEVSKLMARDGEGGTRP